jgi:hypothetical protein
MNNLPSWFNPDEYSAFLAESADLFEMNIPFQKKKREIMMKRRRDDRTNAMRQGRERAQEAIELAQAKAKGIMMGLGEEFKNKLQNTFIEKITEASNALQSEKQKMRPEVDPADRDRDRKREERRQKKLSGLSDVLIVRNKKIGKLEIITTEDFNGETHQLLKGRVKNQDKGPVAKADLVSVSKKAEFMNTKTSMRLLGKIEKEETKKTKSGGSEDTGEETQQTTPPPPPMPRVPRDGKEITDELSSFPDWDHQKTDLVAGIAFGLNGNNEMPPQISQVLSSSRTLADSVNRAVNELIISSPSLMNMNFQLLPPVMKCGKLWAQMSGVAQASPCATMIGSEGKRMVGVAVKIGQQIRPGNKGEPNQILNALLNTENGETIINTFSLLLKDYFKELREVLMTKVPIGYRDDNTFQSGRTIIIKDKQKKLEYEDNKNIFKNRAKQLIEDLLNLDEDLKGAFILECLTGNVKFDGGPGTANMMISVNKDGTNSRLIPLDEMFAKILAETKETYLSTKFNDNANPVSPFDMMYNQSVTNNDNPVNFVSELEKIPELANPVNFMQFFNVYLNDVVYSTPVDYSDYYDSNSDVDTIVTLNPGSKSEKQLRIPVKKTYDNTGKEENVIEKGADHILEEYGMINDYLVDLVNDGQLTKQQAVQYLKEEFNFLTERNYKKEYDNYHSKPEQRANRSKRVLARRKLEKQGRVEKGDGKDVDHKDGNPQNNSEKNLRVLSKSKNRSMNEDHGAGFEGTPELVKKLIKDTPYAGNTPVFTNSKKYVEDGKQTKKK